MSRYIDADALKTKNVYSEERHEKVVPVAEIDWMPTVDAVPVVKCKDCKHGELVNSRQNVWCKKHIPFGICTLDWFCADGERRNDE